MNIGPPEIIIVLLIVLLLFGSARLPKLARSIGEASREFKKGVMEGEEKQKDADNKDTKGPLVERPDDKVTLTKAELDALLAEREARARGEAPPPS